MSKITAQDDMKDCPKCDGTGEVDGKKCPECDGTGKVPVDDGAEGKGKPPAVAEGIPAPAAPPTAERQRIAAILNAPEAKGREDLARMLALETDLTPEAARKVLSAAPTAEKSTNPLAAKMAQVQNPAVGTRGPDEQDTPAAEANRILAFVPKDRRRTG